MASDMVVTRFAPSPTGYLHVGGARTALFSWLLARHHSGRFLLRIEDTDLARSTKEACDQLTDDLKWLGLHWDNRELVLQSGRLDLYNRLIDELMATGMAYKAYEMPEELDAMRKEAEKRKRSFAYRRKELSAEQIQAYERDGRPHVVRFAMPVKEWRFHDVVLGREIVLPPDEAQDFVIRKTDGMPTYHFAVVADDAAMGVTHVLRGQEHTKNTFYHVAIQEALNYPRPVYGHLPIILNPDGSKMGKRDRDKAIRQRAHLWMRNHKKSPAEMSPACGLAEHELSEWLQDSSRQLVLPQQSALMRVIGMKAGELPEILVHDFRKSGYLPEVLLNFLALAGWSPGGDRERMSIQEMISLFSIEGIGRANAKFDRHKLLAFNTEACAAAPIERLVAAMRDYLSVNPDSPLSHATDDELARVIRMKAGFRALREVEETSRFLFIGDDQVVYEPDAVEKVLKKNQGHGLAALREVREVLGRVGQWTSHELERAVQAYCDQKQLGLGKVAQPIRVAVSGSAISPPIFQSLEFLGRDRTLARIERCVAHVSSQ